MEAPFLLPFVFPSSSRISKFSYKIAAVTEVGAEGTTALSHSQSQAAAGVQAAGAAAPVQLGASLCLSCSEVPRFSAPAFSSSL